MSHTRLWPWEKPFFLRRFTLSPHVPGDLPLHLPSLPILCVFPSTLPWSLQEEVRLPGKITALSLFSLYLWLSGFASLLFAFKQESLSPF